MYKKIIGTACFLAIFISIFASVTYLFRGNLFNPFHKDRAAVVGIKEEDALDMVYIGGSAGFCYWIPQQAWKECGFTSYDLGSTSIQAESILYYVKHALKYQDPELLVIGVRSFAYYTGEGYEAGLRYASDSFDFGLDRLRLINTYYKHRNMDTDICSLYVDIMKHHINYDALSSPEAWALADNQGEELNKGCYLLDSYYYLDAYEPFQTQNRRELQPGASETLYELLDYCKQKNLNVLFVVGPYVEPEEDYEIYNSMSDIVSSYGYGFLDANAFYDEMGIDFSEDFADKNHVNVFGAEKYTAFLGKYIMEHYGLPDHRNEGNSNWDESYDRFMDSENEAKASVRDMITSAREGESIAEELRNTENLALWCDLVKDSRFTVLAVGNGEALDTLSHENKKALEALGLSQMKGNAYIRVLCGDEVLYSNEANDEVEGSASIGTNNNIECIVSLAEQEASVLIDGVEYSRKDGDGLNIVVYGNDYRYVVDSFTLCSGVDGKAEFRR